jgi:hypothetical protein
MTTLLRWGLQAAIFGIVGTIARTYIQTGQLPELPMMTH